MKKILTILSLSVFVFLTAFFDVKSAHALSFPVDTAEIGVISSVNQESVAKGSELVITVQVGNAGSVEKTIETVTDTLPDGFIYIDGSTTGVTTENPVIDNRKLIYKGPFQLAADGGTVAISFHAQASTVTGTYTNNASAREKDNSQEYIGQPTQVVVQSMTSLQISNAPQELPSTSRLEDEPTVEQLMRGEKNRTINVVLSSALFVIAFACVSTIVWFFLSKNVRWSIKQRIGKIHIIILLALVYLSSFWFITSNSIVSGPLIIEHNWF